MTIAAPAPGTVTMFTTTWCGYCSRLKSQMGREGIGFTEVNIEDAAADRGVRHVGQRRQPDRADAALPRRLGGHEPLDRRGRRRLT